MAKTITIRINGGSKGKRKKPKAKKGLSYGPVWNGGAFGSRRKKSKSGFPQLKTAQAIKGGLIFGRAAAPRLKWAAGVTVKGGQTAIGLIRKVRRSRSPLARPKNIYGQSNRAAWEYTPKNNQKP